MPAAVGVVIVTEPQPAFAGQLSVDVESDEPPLTESANVVAVCPLLDSEIDAESWVGA